MTDQKIYYLEDSDEHFTEIVKSLEASLHVDIYPKMDTWQTEVDTFQRYLVESNAVNKKAALDLLCRDDFRLIIIDQNINGKDSSGYRIFSNLLEKHGVLKTKKIIFFSGSDTPQRWPQLFNLEDVEIIRKDPDDLPGSAHRLSIAIKKKTGAGSKGIVGAIDRLNRTINVNWINRKRGKP